MANLVRLHDSAKNVLEKKAAQINKKRRTDDKKPLTYGEIVALALDKLTINDGVEK